MPFNGDCTVTTFTNTLHDTTFGNALCHRLIHSTIKWVSAQITQVHGQGKINVKDALYEADMRLLWGRALQLEWLRP